jgi:hypothetical protein
MRITEITRPEEIEDAAKILARAGYRDLKDDAGYTQGSFSTIMHRPGDPFLVKLFVQEDYSYRRFLKLITSVRNPHFPVLRGQPIRVSNFYYGVRIEKLDPFPETGDMASLRYYMEGYLQNLQAGNPVEYMDEWIPESIRTALGLINQYCIQGHPGTIVDLHKYNVMLRGSVPVIIDPTSHDDPSVATPKMGTFDKFPAWKAKQAMPVQPIRPGQEPDMV